MVLVLVFCRAERHIAWFGMNLDEGMDMDVALKLAVALLTRQMALAVGPPTHEWEWSATPSTRPRCTKCGDLVEPDSGRWCDRCEDETLEAEPDPDEWRDVRSDR